MYHCHIHFCILGTRRPLFEVLTQIEPLENFTHSFSFCDSLDLAQVRSSNVILADLRDFDPIATIQSLADAKSPNAYLIALTDLPSALPDNTLSLLDDLWPVPQSEGELKFRFLRCQQNWKRRADAWQTSQYLEATINSIPNMIWYKNKNGIHEKVNDNFCQTVNKSKEQIQGRRHAYIWNVEHDDPACIESERIVMEEKRTCVAEETVQTAGSLPRILTTYKSPLYDLDGSVMGTVGVGVDITQERAYKEELIHKNQTLENLFTTMDCGVMCHSLDGSSILSINRAALTILGYDSAEELVADGFHMVAASVIEEDRTRLQECIKKIREPGDSLSMEYRVRHKNGDLIHVMGNIKLVEEKGERFYQRFLLDFTAKKQEEQRRQIESERRQMELIHALSVDYSLVCFFDLDTGMGKALRIEECTADVLNTIFSGELAFEQCMNQYIEYCVLPEDRDTLRHACSLEFLSHELDEKQKYYVNYRTSCKNGVRYFQMKAVRAGQWENARGVVLGFRNVDDETRAELEKKNILEDALLQANRANKAKSAFLSNMSHDIRTPMNAIVGFTTLALTHMDRREQVEEYLKKILISGNHLVSLINDVLDMSRIESGKMRLEETLCSLPDILHSLRSIVQADIRAKQLDFYIDTVDVLDEDIYCDKLRLNQILLNLLSNSIKYTGAGGTVSVRIIEKPGAPMGYANYEFRIKDNGIGMSEEFVSHIFEPFERERNSTISGIQGTGLGMAITKNIVEMMNGSISVTSEKDVGTESVVNFTFRLRSGPKEVQTISGLKNCRALVVDDDFNTCDSVTYMLQQFGMRAEWTLSGREAVLRTRQAIMRNDNYCVYIIDWLMPDMNGIEVARRIRKETGEDVPIIVLTAYDWSDIEHEAKEAGVTTFCSKPLFASELRRCLHSIVNTNTVAEDAAPEPPTHHTGRILLAEDNKFNQEIALAILEEAGFSVEIAGDGQTAVDMLQKSEPGYYQLILMDVQMPVMDGYEATKAIRALDAPELAGIPILAMTANAFEEDRQRALQCGMNGHIAKPIDIQTLFNTLDQILN